MNLRRNISANVVVPDGWQNIAEAEAATRGVL